MVPRIFWWGEKNLRAPNTIVRMSEPVPPPQKKLEDFSKLFYMQILENNSFTTHALEIVSAGYTWWIMVRLFI